MINLIYINDIPHWEEDDVVLPIMAGGQTPDEILRLLGTGISPEGRVTGPTTDTTPGGSQELTFEQMLALAQASVAQSIGHRPPTFGETRQGFEFQAGQDRGSRSHCCHRVRP